MLLKQPLVGLLDIHEVLASTIEHDDGLREAVVVARGFGYVLLTLLDVVVLRLSTDFGSLLVQQVLLQLLEQANVVLRHHFLALLPLQITDEVVSIAISLHWVTAHELETTVLEPLLEQFFKVFLVDDDPLLHARVPVVLDRVVSPALEDVGDVGPLVGSIPVL